MRNSIISGATCVGSITDGLRNIDFPGSTCPGTAADPRLGPLAPNGGSTNTFRLLPAERSLECRAGHGCQLPRHRPARRRAPVGRGVRRRCARAGSPAAVTGGAGGIARGRRHADGHRDPSRPGDELPLRVRRHHAYGRTSAGGSSSGAAARSVSLPVGALTPDTTYHYRLVASGPDGTARGANATFRTAKGAGAVTPVALRLTGLRVSPSAPPGRPPRAHHLPALHGGERAPVGPAGRAGGEAARSRPDAVRARHQGQRAPRGPRGPAGCWCTAYLGRGSLRPKGKAGANSVTFRGRVGRRKLRRAPHRVVATARRASGGPATRARSARFQMIR